MLSDLQEDHDRLNEAFGMATCAFRNEDVKQFVREVAEVYVEP